jgi:hypothetical protein
VSSKAAEDIDDANSDVGDSTAINVDGAASGKGSLESRTLKSLKLFQE